MPGYPYYSNSENNEGDVYLSDYILVNGKFFFIGFSIALLMSPKTALAVEAIENFGISPTDVPVPSPTVAPSRVPTDVRNLAQTIAAVAGCSYATKSCGGVVNQAVKTSSEKLSTVNPPTALAIGVCLLTAGYCAGKLSTKAIDNLLGF